MIDRILIKQVEEFAKDAPWEITLLANVSALIYDSLENINWAGFYLIRNEELVLGPFQGKPACVRIPIGKGVCGTAVETDSVQLVADVHTFPGHIACDSASESEIVIPIHRGGNITGVLDIDSPVKGRFDNEDRAVLCEIVRILESFYDNLPLRID